MPASPGPPSAAVNGEADMSSKTPDASDAQDVEDTEGIEAPGEFADSEKLRITGTSRRSTSRGRWLCGKSTKRPKKAKTVPRSGTARTLRDLHARGRRGGAEGSVEEEAPRGGTSATRALFAMRRRWGTQRRTSVPPGRLPRGAASAAEGSPALGTRRLLVASPWWSGCRGFRPREPRDQPPGSPGRSVTVVIPAGASTHKIAELLAKAGSSTARTCSRCT